MPEDFQDATKEILFQALVTIEGMSVIPDLFNVLGSDKFFEVMALFGGMTITFPSEADIKDTLRDVMIYHDHTVNDTDVQALEHQYDVSLEIIQRSLTRVRRALNFGAKDLEV